MLVYAKENDTVKSFPTDPSSNYWGDKTRGKHNSLSDAHDEAFTIGDLL
ncbi:MAG: hypothetical protein NY202_02730 [Mollicutes bacterium UO1]